MLKKSVATRDAALRTNAAIALREIGVQAPSALPCLQIAVDDSTSDVRAEAQEAMRRITVEATTKTPTGVSAANVKKELANQAVALQQAQEQLRLSEVAKEIALKRAQEIEQDRDAQVHSLKRWFITFSVYSLRRSFVFCACVQQLLSRPSTRNLRMQILYCPDSRGDAFLASCWIAYSHSTISFCMSVGPRGRPRGRDFHFQKRPNPLRCQRIKVSGLTMVRVFRQSKKRESRASVTRMESVARRGFVFARYRVRAVCVEKVLGGNGSGRSEAQTKERYSVTIRNESALLQKAMP
jgi:hypothetical protein